MEIRYEPDVLTGADLANLRRLAGWGDTPAFQAERAVRHSLFTVTASNSVKVVGAGRLVGDGALIWYIQDLIVLPECRGMGIGTQIAKRLVDHARKNSLPGTAATIGLMAARGREGFYERLGFRARPNDREGAGMVLNMQIT